MCRSGLDDAPGAKDNHLLAGGGGGQVVVDILKEGEVFILLAEEDGWSKIQYDEKVEGWVVSRFLKKI